MNYIGLNELQLPGFKQKCLAWSVIVCKKALFKLNSDECIRVSICIIRVRICIIWYMYDA